MGANTTGVPNSNNYLLGRGEIYAAELESNDKPLGYRLLGNAPAVSLTREIESIEHTSSLSGTATVDKEVVTSQSATVTITLDEIEFENLKLFFAGDLVSQSNAGGVAGVVGNGNLTLPASGSQGKWYDLYQTATGAPANNSFTDRIYDTGAITFGTAGTGAVEGVDFEVDLKMGRIFIIEGSAILVDGASYDVNIAANGSAAATVEVLRAQTGVTLVRAVKFISINPSNSNKETEYQMHKVTLKPTGDLALIGDEFAQFQLEGKLESSTYADSNSPFMNIVDHANS